MRFQIIYQQILEKTLNIKKNEFKFFKNTDNSSTECVFNTLDQNSQPVQIRAVINQNDITFKTSDRDGDKMKTYTEKQFMMAYYKAYQKFKQAFSVYQKDPDFFKNNKTDKNENENGIKIKSLNEVLHQEDLKNNGVNIKVKGMSFDFMKSEQNIPDIAQCSFVIQNNGGIKSQNQLQNYQVIVTVKINEVNSKLVNIELFDPEDIQKKQPVQTMTQSRFKEQYKQEYYKFIQALSMYSKNYMR